MSLLGLVTLGQTPRQDFELEFGRYCQADIRMIGALDGIDRRQISQLENGGGIYPLHARLSDGSRVDIPMATFLPLIEKRVRDLESLGADVIVILCSGHLPDIPAAVPLLLPGKITLAVAQSLCRTGRIGTIVPNRGQIARATEIWGEVGITAKVVCASPFKQAEIESGALDLADPSLEFILVDCMGHSSALRDRIAELSGRPTLLAQTIVARVTGEVIDSLSGHVRQRVDEASSSLLE